MWEAVRNNFTGVFITYGQNIANIVFLPRAHTQRGKVIGLVVVVVVDDIVQHSYNYTVRMRKGVK